MLNLTIVGHLGKDATINDRNGRKVINFTVAHSEKYKDAHGTAVTKTIWVECAKWGDQTAVAAFLKKGTLVAVTGRPEAQAYADKQGKPAASLRCTVDFVQLLGGNKDDKSESQAQPSTSNTNGVSPAMGSTDVTDDLPF